MAITIPGLRANRGESQLGVQQLTTPDAPLLEAAGGLQQVSEIQMRKEQRDADAFLAKQSTDLLLESQDLFETVKNEVEDPNKIAETFFQKYDELSGSKLKNAPNQLATRELERKSRELKATLGKAAIGLQADEVQTQRLNGVQESINKAAITVRNSGNLALGQLAIEEALAGAESYTTPSELEELKKKASFDVKSAYLDRLFESGDVKEVRKLINDTDFATDFNIRQIDAYRKSIKQYEEKRAENMERLRTTNPYGYAEIMGLNAGSIDFQSPMTTQMSLIQREEFRVEAAKENIELPLLAPNEVKLLQESYNQLPKQDKSGFLTQLNRAMTPEQIGEAAQQVFPEDPPLAAGMALAGEAPQAVIDSIIDGADVFKQRAAGSLPGSIKLPTVSEFQELFDVEIGSAILDDTARSQIAQTAYYMALSKIKQDPDFIVEEDSVQDIIDSLIGPVIESGISGNKIMTFRNTKEVGNPFLDEDDFNDLFSKITDESLKARGFSSPRTTLGERFPADLLFDFTNPVTIGDGKYYLQTVDGRYLLDDNDNPYIFDFKAYHEAGE